MKVQEKDQEGKKQEPRRIMSSARLWERRKRKYRFGDFVSNSTDLGVGANRLYRQVMREDDLREERQRINEILSRLNRKERRFAAAIVKRRMSFAKVTHLFRLESWEAEARLEEIIAKIEKMNPEPLVRHVLLFFGFAPGCTMKKNLLHSDS